MNQDKILVVDDNDDMRAIVVRGLKTGPHEIHEADSGEKALPLIAANDFDLVLTDLMMKRVNGLEVIQAAKTKDPRVEAVLMTAHGSLESNAEAMKLGASGYLLKPIELEELLKKTKECLDRRRLSLNAPGTEKETPESKKMTREMATALMLGTLLRLILKSACDVLKADGGSLLVKRKNGLVVEAVSPNFKDEVMGRTLNGNGGAARRSFHAGEPLLLGEEVRSDVCFNGFQEPRSIESALAAPLKDEGKTLGVLCLARTGKRGAFTEKDFALAAPFLDGLTTAVKNAAMYEELKEAYQKLKTAQDRLIHSERMSAIGRVTSSLAHELNNPMVSILGNAQVLLEEIKEDNQWREDVRVIEQNAFTCKRIITELLGFSRQGDFKFADVNVVRVVDKVLALTQFQLSRGNIKVVKEFDPEPPPVKASEPHLEQVFMNFVINAQQAMPAGGTLTLRSRLLGAAAAAGKNADAFKKGGALAVEFQDTGIGIKKENLYRILEPFFTTKKEGEGTGLGLSVCDDIVKRHHGVIEVESDGEGLGAKITVLLPLGTHP